MVLKFQIDLDIIDGWVGIFFIFLNWFSLSFFLKRSRDRGKFILGGLFFVIFGGSAGIVQVLFSVTFCRVIMLVSVQWGTLFWGGGGKSGVFGFLGFIQFLLQVGGVRGEKIGYRRQEQFLRVTVFYILVFQGFFCFLVG